MRDDTNNERMAADGGVGESAVQADWTRYEQPMLGIVETIAAVKGTRPTEMAPLGGAIDVDALTALLESGEQELSITFQYQEYVVTVSGSGAVTVEPSLA